jgi:iron complex outermembrane receptor protein
MKSLAYLIIILLFSSVSYGQNTFKAIVKDIESKEPLVGATVVVQGTTNGGVAGPDGFVEIKNIPDGKRVLVFRFVGYEERTDTFIFPVDQSKPLEIFLSAGEEEMEEVYITATRSSRTIDDVPTRVEAISGEELEEKGNMKPGDIRMMLNESTGIQTQQTSATSYNSSIRIQGLDGKYTQILRDGYPLYTGFSGGLGLLQIVPLDLAQVEVIKGASSTLYGGGAMAGLVNLVSKMPSPERELNFMVNGTSALGLDISGYYSQKFKRLGTTVFGSYNGGTPYDPAGIGLTAIPRYHRGTMNSKLYYYLSPDVTVYLGLNSTVESRLGGDIRYIEGKGDSIHSYFEKNNTSRFSSQFGVNYSINNRSHFELKNSFGYYKRKIMIPEYRFSGVQLSTFSEVSYTIDLNKSEWIAGLNLWTDRFKQDKVVSIQAVDYDHSTLGAFLQNTWNISEFLVLETGVRGDYQNEYGFFFLPRLSVLFRLIPDLTARLGGGLGYKPPTVFTEDAERLQFRNVLPVEESDTRAEQSVSSNLDINYRTVISREATFSINNLFFYTRISDPLVLTALTDDHYEFVQPGGAITTKGIETNLKITWRYLKLFVGYTLADVTRKFNGMTSAFPLVAKHRLNNVLMVEVEDKLKVGLEAYYYSPQLLTDGTSGESYWIFGLMAEKLWEHFSIFINFENISDTRQTRFESIYSGSITNPLFRDIFAPLDGFVVNGGLKVKL